MSDSSGIRIESLRLALKSISEIDPNQSESQIAAMAIMVDDEILKRDKQGEVEGVTTNSIDRRVIELRNALAAIAMMHPQASPSPAEYASQSLTRDKELAEQGKTTLPGPANCIEAISLLRQAFEADPEYAWSWHSNLAMMAYDAGAPSRAANTHAASLMNNLFSYDITQTDIYKGRMNQ